MKIKKFNEFISENDDPTGDELVGSIVKVTKSSYLHTKDFIGKTAKIISFNKKKNSYELRFESENSQKFAEFRKDDFEIESMRKSSSFNNKGLIK